MSGLLHRLGGSAARRGKWFVGTWVALVIGLALLANAVGRPTNDNLDLPGTGSTKATDLLDAKLPQAANGSVPIVIEDPGGDLTTEANQKAISETTKALKANTYVIEAISPFSQQGAANISEDKQIAFISVVLNVSSAELDESEANDILDAADPARKAGLEVSAGGYLGQEVSQPGTESSEAIGIAVALVVLLLAFGTFTLMPLPIATAIAALGAGLAVVGLLGHVADIPTLAPTVGIMLGLGVGIDYSLFIINRHQRQFREGVEARESVARAIATSGTAVVFAGTTVIIALLSLYFGGIPLVTSLGYATAVVVAVAVIAAISFLPGLLGMLGPRIESLRVGFLSGERPDDDGKHGWARWAETIGRHTILAALAGIAVLVVLAIPIIGIRLGAPDFGQLPTSTTDRQAYDALTKGFGVGVNGQLLVAVDFDGSPAKPNSAALPGAEQQQQQAELGGTPAQQQQAAQQVAFDQSPASDARLVKLEQEIGKQGDVASVTQAQVSKNGKAAAFSVVPKTSPSAKATQDLVNHLRNETIPDATKGTSLTASVGGTTAAYIDLADKISEKLPLVIAIVVALSFLLLTVAFRAPVISLLSAALNLLAVVAAYGILTFVFEDGHGLGLIGLDNPLPVVSYVPLMMFAILFGLSMDYQVFLLSRVSEHHRAGGDSRKAVIEGLGLSAKVIATAAVIMFAVFLSFVINGNPTVKQFGVGLAAAVAIDAVVVLVVFPALLLLLGRASFALPDWMERSLPRVGVEGDESYR